MKNTTFLSIIIPCRNEEKYIKECLTSVIKNNYPKESLEILVVDGRSTDNTREIVTQMIAKYPYIKLLDNPKKITPTALNIGVQNSRGDIIMRMDSHSRYKTNYISSCITNLKKYDVDNIGGIFATTPRYNTFIAKAIANVLSQPFGVGNSIFRTYPKKVQEADTVAFGCYKRSVFERIGLFNENLKRSQDMEFNIRLKKAGGKIILFPEIICYYYAPSNYIHFLIHSYTDGVWATYPTKFTKQFLHLRHYIPLIFVLSVVISGFGALVSIYSAALFFGIIVSYMSLNIFFSIVSAVKLKNPLYLLLHLILFPTFHVSYGIGSLIGVLKIALPAEATAVPQLTKTNGTS